MAFLSTIRMSNTRELNLGNHFYKQSGSYGSVLRTLVVGWLAVSSLATVVILSANNQVNKVLGWLNLSPSNSSHYLQCQRDFWCDLQRRMCIFWSSLFRASITLHFKAKIYSVVGDRTKWGDHKGSCLWSEAFRTSISFIDEEALL